MFLYCDNFSEAQVAAAAKALPGRVYYTARGRKYITVADIPAQDKDKLEPIFLVLDALRAAASGADS